MKTNSISARGGRRPAALLWDESFLWGVMARQALLAQELPFDLIRAGEVRAGKLENYELLFVPGGWASNKMKALGEDGIGAIKRFVQNGGAYLGFCGGAGLATEDGMGLLPVKRRPTRERVPSFSGRIRLNTSNHPIWQGIAEPVFHAWWPSQFIAGEGLSVLATYGEALPDAFSSDINVGDAEHSRGWKELERLYQINLDPKRLAQEPAVIEGGFGKGRVVLSLLHFDTPDDPKGARVLGNLWSCLAPGGKGPHAAAPSPVEHTGSSGVIKELEEAVADVIELGRRNFLWFRRNRLLLQWRRGVRGLEYCTLDVMIREIARELSHRTCGSDLQLDRIRRLLLPFLDKARELLVRERFAMQDAPITYERCDDAAIQALREELFSRSKSHGGRFKEILDELDDLLYRLLTTSE